MLKSLRFVLAEERWHECFGPEQRLLHDHTRRDWEGLLTVGQHFMVLYKYHGIGGSLTRVWSFWSGYDSDASRYPALFLPVTCLSLSRTDHTGQTSSAFQTD